MASNSRARSSSVLLRDIQSSLATAVNAQPAQPHVDVERNTPTLAPDEQRVALLDEKSQLAAAHRKRMLELDAMRKQLERRAEDVEAAAKAIERERSALKTEYAAKITEMAAAKGKLEAQVRRLACAHFS